jgi:hypothetical protein
MLARLPEAAVPKQELEIPEGPCHIGIHRGKPRKSCKLAGSPRNESIGSALCQFRNADPGKECVVTTFLARQLAHVRPLNRRLPVPLDVR